MNDKIVSGYFKVTDSGLCQGIRNQIKNKYLFNGVQVHRPAGLEIYTLREGGRAIVDEHGNCIIFEDVDRDFFQNTMYQSINEMGENLDARENATQI